MKYFYIFLSTLLIVGCGKKEEPNTDDNFTGTASATIDGFKWKGQWASALGANIGSNIMTLSLSTTEQNRDISFSFGINDFKGKGTYNYSENDLDMTFSLSYSGEGYSNVPLQGGGGSGEITITNIVEGTGFTNFGRLEGTFSGTVKNVNSFEVLEINDGKFSAIKL